MIHTILPDPLHGKYSRSYQDQTHKYISFYTYDLTVADSRMSYSYLRGVFLPLQGGYIDQPLAYAGHSCAQIRELCQITSCLGRRHGTPGTSNRFPINNGDEAGSEAGHQEEGDQGSSGRVLKAD